MQPWRSNATVGKHSDNRPIQVEWIGGTGEIAWVFLRCENCDVAGTRAWYIAITVADCQLEFEVLPRLSCDDLLQVSVPEHRFGTKKHA